MIKDPQGKLLLGAFPVCHRQHDSYGPFLGHPEAVSVQLDEDRHREECDALVAIAEGVAACRPSCMRKHGLQPIPRTSALIAGRKGQPVSLAFSSEWWHSGDGA